MSEWQPIETAPKDEPLIGCDMNSGEYYPFSMVWDHEYGWRDPNWDGNFIPTHWMRRPAPPVNNPKK
jgi:hypothetical protein